MRTYSPWNNCTRCDRAGYRWGIFAPASAKASVLVLTAAASRASQAYGAPDPLPSRVAAAIAGLYKVSQTDVHVDTLLACGASGTLQAHEAAACFQRVDDQAGHGGWPLKLVVLVGDHTARLARYAGLVSATGFQVAGQVYPFAVIQGEEQVGQDPSWNILQKRRVPTSAPSLFPTAADTLARLIAGRCRSYGWHPVGGEWRRVLQTPPGILVDRHVRGRGWLSPYRPYGPWPYCVIDIDLHNAVQYAQYDETLRKVRSLFKNSLVFRSSPTGGAHIYVRLPPETTYPEGAVRLTEFLLNKGLLFTAVPPGKWATTRGRVAAQLVDVPLHPPRLPFGRGSALYGTPDPTKAVVRFSRWLDSTDAGDFEATVKGAAQDNARTRWPGRAKWARRYVQDLQTQVLMGSSKASLPPGDPWQPYLSRLAPPVALLAASGCLAFGTRGVAMTRLSEALAEMVDRDTARFLLRYWVEERDHRSEDIHTAKEGVLEYADRLVNDAFAGRGVPAGIWSSADVAVSKLYTSVTDGQNKPLGLSEEECRRAAFHILELFYRARLGRRVITAEKFGLALQNDNFGGLPVRRPNQDRVKDVRRIMKRLFLTEVRKPDYVRHIAGEYELRGPYWPPPSSGGRRTFAPASGMGP